MKKIIIPLILSVVVSSARSQSAAADSLGLQNLIDNVIGTYPALKKAGNDIVAMDAKIGLTKTAYLPDVSFSGSYSRVGPTTSITMPINGTSHTFSLFPENVYNATVSVNENIYDFGKTAKNLALDEQNKTLVMLSVDQVKQRLSTAVMLGYYSMGVLQESIKIKTEQLNNLKEHLSFIQKKADTGSATRYDITSTKVRISIIENQIVDLQTSLQIQTAQLNSYLGKPAESVLMLKKPVFTQQLVLSVDSLCGKAFANRTEMKISRQKEEVAKSKLDVVNVQNNPAINFFASGGYKNGYLNESLQDVGKLNFAVGVGVKVPLFDANRSKYTKVQAHAEMDSNQQETEVLKRNITNEIVECRSNVLSALKKVRQSELQLDQAQQAYGLAEVNYKAGAITNLDLLDTYNQLSDTQLMLFKTKIDYLVSFEKLKIAIGQQLY